MSRFMFATGIENSYPTIKIPNGEGRVRVDEMEKCGHYKHWKEDFQLTKELGIEFLRYGPPLYKTHLAPGKYDWSFADETFHALKEMGITPITDLCHFGVPDFIGDLRNPDFPKYFAEYAKAFAHRYPWVTLYTPVNEIYVCAKMSGQHGIWNECDTSDWGFVTALKNLCQANVRAMHAIIDERGDNVTFIQSESSEYYHCNHPDGQSIADFHNERRFLSLDLSYGRDVSSKMYQYLMDNGMSREGYDWFGKNQVSARCVMGNDYYKTNEHMVQGDGSITAPGAIFGYYVITHQYFRRYKLPVMHTETNLPNSKEAPDWLHKEWANVRRLREDGVPILGFTYYSLTDQVDWDTALAQDNGRDNPLGLYDLNRKIRPVGEAYRELIKNWKDAMENESYNVVFGS